MRKHLKFILLLLLTALILWWFGRKLDWGEVQRAVSKADARLLALAIVVVCLTYVLRAFRWRTLLAPLTEAGMRALFIATTVGFGSLFVFGRAGEVVRPIVLPLRDRRVKPAASFVTIIVERLCDSLAMLVLFALNLLWFRVPVEHFRELLHGRFGDWVLAMFEHGRVTGLILLTLAVLSVAALSWFERRAPSAIGWLDQRFKSWRFVPERLRNVLTHTLEQLASALGILADPRELAVTVGWTTILWLSITLADWLVLRAFGLPFGFSETVFVMGWALVGSLVPTPGGAAGAFHAATAASLIFLGVERDQAAAVSIITHLVVFAPALIFGLYYVLRGEINISRLRRIAASSEVEHAVEEEVGEPAEVAADQLKMSTVKS